MALRSCAPAFGVALLLAGCADGPSPVTAEKLLEVAGLRAVVNAVALSPDGASSWSATSTATSSRATCPPPASAGSA
jgi:hypothetical protein